MNWPFYIRWYCMFVHRDLKGVDMGDEAVGCQCNKCRRIYWWPRGRTG